MTIGKGVSEAQIARLDALKKGIHDFIAAKGPEKYASTDPIRLWVSFLKHHPHARVVKEQFEKELETLGNPPYKAFLGF